MHLSTLSYLLIAASTDVGVATLAVDPATPERSQVLDQCASARCRAGCTLTLVDAAGRGTTVTIPPGPIVRDGVLTLVPGEAFTVDGDIRDDKLSNLRVVQDGPAGSAKITVGFVQGRHKGEGAGMAFRLENHYSKRVRYRARILIAGSAVVASTTVCEVAPGTTSYEFWPEAIQEIQLFDFSLAEWKEGEPLRCE